MFRILLFHSAVVNCSQYAGLFQCDNGVCIPRSELCDKIDECGDGSDERNCPCNKSLI